MRLDAAIAQCCPQFSRERIKAWLKDGAIQVNGALLRGKDKIAGGEAILIAAKIEVVVESVAEPLALTIVHEDEALLVINKPAGLVVHPGAGNPTGTLMNGLLHHCPALAQLPRAGIVHRIDKETTGLLVIAKTLEAHTSLVQQMQEHAITRAYVAIVQGELISGGTVDQPLARDPRNRQRMAIVESGKPAITHYRLAERLSHFTVLNVTLETGRTHQIRVHMASIQHPLLGDPVYGGRLKMPKGFSDEQRQTLRDFKRQALHARLLGLTHPTTGEYCEWEAPLPEDMGVLLKVLRN